MDVATLAPSARQMTSDPQRLRDVILVRVGIEARDMTRAEVAKDLSVLVAHRFSAADCRHAVDRNLAALADAGLVELKTVAVIVTAAGRKRAQMVLGGKAVLPKSWREARDVRLVAKALGMEEEGGSRLKLLTKPEGLKAAIVQRAFNIALRGVVTPSRLRAALAAIALERAFGGKSGTSSTTKKTGLSAKDGRALASQLTADQRNYGTDARLVAALAVQVIGASGGDFATLQASVLRRYVDGARMFDDVVPAKRRAPARRVKRRGAVRGNGAYHAPEQLDLLGFTASASVTAPVLDSRVDAHSEPVGTIAITRPDLVAFVAEVRRIADRLAEGWAGNRKAFINRVWRATEAERPEWGLSVIEFKAMLTEAHRAGSLALAHADLKDNSTLRDVQESQIAFKNTIFHFIRADG